MSQGYYGTTNTSTFTGYGNVVNFRFVRMLPPPKHPDQLWIEQVVGHPLPVQPDPRECARVRAALECLGFVPPARWDPQEAKKTYRRMARELHPDVGGDEAAFKDLSNHYDTLRRRGFFG